MSPGAELLFSLVWLWAAPVGVFAYFFLRDLRRDTGSARVGLERSKAAQDYDRTGAPRALGGEL